jgi:hypothetical protein
LTFHHFDFTCLQAELPYLTVAVKKLFTHSKAVDEIGSEVYARKALDLKHENLVNLIASYSRRHLILLIYEYMEHGSLGQVLFGNFLISRSQSNLAFTNFANQLGQVSLLHLIINILV